MFWNLDMMRSNEKKNHQNPSTNKKSAGRGAKSPNLKDVNIPRHGLIYFFLKMYTICSRRLFLFSRSFFRQILTHIQQKVFLQILWHIQQKFFPSILPEVFSKIYINIQQIFPFLAVYFSNFTPYLAGSFSSIFLFVY